MRHFTFRPTVTMKGRTFQGLRGWSGKPLHPPLTDVPVTADLFVAVFDVLSIAAHAGHPSIGRQLSGSWSASACLPGRSTAACVAPCPWPTPA